MKTLKTLLIVVALFSLISQCRKVENPVIPENEGTEYIGLWKGETSQKREINFKISQYLSLVGINDITYSYKIGNCSAVKGIYGPDSPLGYIDDDSLSLDMIYFKMDGLFYNPDSMNGSLTIIHCYLDSTVSDTLKYICLDDTLSVTYYAIKDSI